MRDTARIALWICLFNCHLQALVPAPRFTARVRWQEARRRNSCSGGSMSAGGEISQRVKEIRAGPLKHESIPLPNGVSMETITQGPSSRSEKRAKTLPPLLFVHGSYHAAWCWSEHWMPFFAGKGYETYAVSLRGTAGTPLPVSAGPRRSVRLSEHVGDLRAFIALTLKGRAPVVICHSFGGLVGLKLLEELLAERAGSGGGGGGGGGGGARSGSSAGLAGIVLMCSVPPSGNGAMIGRFVREKPIAAFKIVLGFVFKLAVVWPWLARDLFFSKSLEQAALNRYMANFKVDSKVGLDLGDLRTVLPSHCAGPDGRANWIGNAPPRLVIGGERDYIVDVAGVAEMAEFLDTEYILLPTVPHDVMLGPDWPHGADRLLAWLETTELRLR